MSETKKSVNLLLYCTKAKPYLYQSYEYEAFGEDELGRFYIDNNVCPETILNGKVVAECECDLVEDLSKYEYKNKDNHFYDVLKNACLTTSDLEKYCPVKMGKYKSLYAIHLKNVKPFDTPKELSDYHTNKKCNSCFTSGYEATACTYSDKCIVPAVVNRAPQNMMIVYDNDGNLYILISIRPEWLCKILNGEKTIEVRKSIVNVLKELIPNA